MNGNRMYINLHSQPCRILDVEVQGCHGQGKSLILSKSVKSQGILFSGLQFISFLQDFEMHFLSEKMKSMLQSKQSDQFDT